MNSLVWHLRDRALDLSARHLVMGILNVTPDSFSDGGRYADPVARGLQLIEHGADILDVGGESTRPGAEPVSLEEELRRVVPVVGELASRASAPISVETMKPEVAREALAAGAAILNDVSGFRDPRMIKVAREARCGVVAMHMRGDPATMQHNPQYADAVGEVTAYLQERLRALGE